MLNINKTVQPVYHLTIAKNDREKRSTLTLEKELPLDQLGPGCVFDHCSSVQETITYLCETGCHGIVSPLPSH